MWISRLWILLCLSGLGALAGGALVALPGLGEADLGAARRAHTEQIAARLEAELRHALADRRASARRAAEHGAVGELQGLLTEGLPEHLRAPIIGQLLSKISQAHPRFGWALYDQAGLQLGATAPELRDLPATPILGRAAPDKLGVGLVGERWLVAARIPSDSGWILVQISPSPAESLRRLHADAKLDAPLAVFAPGQTTGPAPLVAAAEGLAEAATADLELDGVAWHTRRFPLAAAPGLSFALAWPAVVPASLDQVGGLGGLLAAALSGAPPALLCLGFAALAWLIGLLLHAYGLRRAVARLTDALGLLPGGDLDPGQLPAWLTPAARAASEAAQVIRNRAGPVETGAAPPDAEASAEASASVSAEASAPGSAEDNAEVSAEAGPASGAEGSAEVSAEGSAEASAAPGAEASASHSSEASASHSAEASASHSAPAGASASHSAEASASHSAPAGASAERRPSAKAAASRDRPSPAAVTRAQGPGRVEAEDSAEISGEGTVEQPRPGPRRPAGPRATSAPPGDPRPEREPVRSTRPRPGHESPEASLFEMPAVRPRAVDDELDPEPDGFADSDIRLPQNTGRPRPPARTGGLLARLQAQAALEPERRPPAPGEQTQVRPMPLELFATPDPEGEAHSVAPSEAPAERGPRQAQTYAEVHARFVAVKRAQGELEPVDFERFCAKLDRTRAALMARFDCADVRFRVYVKDGKAALRAAPVLDDGGAPTEPGA